MEIALAALVILIGSYVQSSIGFGLAIISAPLLFAINPLYVPGPVTLCALTLSLANTYHHRKAVSLKGLQFAIAGRIPGTIAGGFLLLWISHDALALWLGGSVLVAVGLSLSSIVIRPTNPAMVTAGFLSGFMGTSSSIGGPPMALVMQHEGNDFIRANLAAFFIVSCVMSLIMLTSIDRFGSAELLICLPLLPSTLVGYWLARKTMHRISHRKLRLLSLLLCAAAGSGSILSVWL